MGFPDDERLKGVELDYSEPVRMEGRPEPAGMPVLFFEIFVDDQRPEHLKSEFGVSADAPKEVRLMLLDVAIKELQAFRASIEAGTFNPVNEN